MEEDKTQTEKVADQLNSNTTTTLTPAESNLAIANRKLELDSQSAEIIKKIVEEKDPEKVKDLTYLFNINQNKKTMARVDACNDVIDGMIAQWRQRVSTRPDEMSNDDILRGIKTFQELMERGQRQVAEVNDNPAPPVIQIKTDEININNGADDELKTRDSREKVKRAVLAALAKAEKEQEEADVIDAEVVEDGKK